jgi:hypothetical protein
MMAQYGPYDMTFGVGLVVVSVLVALTVAGVGLFIVVQVSYLGQVRRPLVPSTYTSATWCSPLCLFGSTYA